MIDVVWANYNPELVSGRCCWDQAMLTDILDGKLWRTAFDYRHTESFDDVSGAVVVIPGAANRDHAEDLQRDLDRLGWALVIVTSDEEGLFPWHTLRHPRMDVWRQYGRPGEGARPFPIGYRPGTRERCRDLDRTYEWAFAGQVNHPRREQCAEVLRTLPGGYLVETGGFAQGITQEAYMHSLSLARVAPCPSGYVHVDSFRLYEALEAGCVPIVDGRTSKDDAAPFWKSLFGTPAFPIVEDWGDFPYVLGRILAGGMETANGVSAWWQAEKRKLVRSIDIAVEELSGDTPFKEVDDRVTVLMPTSPVPSNPSLAVIAETIESVRAQLPEAEIVVMSDGVRDSQPARREAYEEFRRRLLWSSNHEWHGVLPVLFERHQHQANMTRSVLKDVHTPLVLFVEHDTPLVGDIDWDACAQAVLEGEANAIRFHYEAQVLDVHQHLMPDQEPRDIAGAPLLRCAQWSQRPHLASTDFYREMIDRYFGPDSRTMIEDRMHSVIAHSWFDHGVEGWAPFKLFMYAPPGDIKRSTHLDARGDDPKFEDEFFYDARDDG